MDIQTPILITFIGYLALMMGIGYWAYRKTDTVDDYILGGRKMGPAVTALSVGASDMSGWLLLGLPGAVYLSGLGEAWIGFGLVFGAWLNWLFVAKRLRIYTQVANNSLTLPDFFENRFNDSHGLLKLVSALTILIFFTFYASSGMVGGAILFEKVFGLDYTVALLIGSFIIVSYTFVGGFFAVSWTDFFQGCLMLIALIIVPVSIFSQPDTQAGFEQIDPAMLSFINENTTVIGLVSLLAWGLGYFGQPHILSRFMAIGSPKDLVLSRRIAMTWMIVSLFGALATGIAGSLYFAAEPLENSETVFIHLAHAAFNPWVGGLLIAAILSAIMSTIDSQLLVCSSVITEDFYLKWLRPQASSKELMLVGRIGVIAIALVAGVVALNPESSVLGLVSYAWAGFGAAFGPVVLLSLFWQGYSRNGAIATILVGAITVVVWKQMTGGIFELYEIVPGFIFAMLVGVIVSKISPPTDKTIADFSAFRESLKTQ
ncbi:sodium/proline symporter PutP [Shewanella sp. SR43-4]|jgi:sodium/proline symporter|uniref:Sodium/proline symporter n=3 Tax=Shewanella TaxID=22 RepID=A0ABV0FUU1_9GAMM|nr:MULTISPECIES: sodium/proline symporter PutP [Shewanella]MBB1318296.1 sodium/proline symporter PutP [Shewanella sp. SR43-4]MBB1322786.1 sodium/proline symporter PutP [Shewanella sp. SR43-8]RPA51162.1 sodium/proline symporter PutP [Shewanella vesiculosa]UJL43043.1 sodium/proline symporter PutP [Shewanella vesiculosa]|tara:strand:+ start:3539 stop:4999 length:1461 start_codon:yes stop_codon:yes gene_type:complete